MARRESIEVCATVLSRAFEEDSGRNGKWLRNLRNSFTLPWRSTVVRLGDEHAPKPVCGSRGADTRKAGLCARLSGSATGSPLPPDSNARNYVEKSSQTMAIRIEQFLTYWRGSMASARRGLRRCRHHCNHGRWNRALDGRPPAAEVVNYSRN